MSVLESWDAAGHLGQVRLRARLDTIVELVGPVIGDRSGSLGLSLDVGLGDHIDLTSGGHDLDTYRFPVIRTLGAGRFDAAFARKAPAAPSTMAVGPVTPAAPDTDGWGGPQMEVRTSVSASSTAGKQAIRRRGSRHRGRDRRPDGPPTIKEQKPGTDRMTSASLPVREGRGYVIEPRSAVNQRSGLMRTTT
ncbi:hypothetical protein ACFYXS_38980 [Streptomyces sp. NPDC002574]|uniref:hypothetical protein n=1 Tax=Streptomyces sp. NPDC002574 TaxID=3364652 RepID=UPI00369A3522